MFDAHSHLTAEALESSSGSAISGVSVCSAVPLDWRAVLALEHPDLAVFPSIGIHPWQAHLASGKQFGLLERLLEGSPRAGIGEVGLDGSTRYRATLSLQLPVFARQLALAGEKRCVSLHCVGAWGPLLEELRCCTPRRFVVHGCSASAEIVEEICALGGYISIGPAVLRPNAKRVHESARRTPLNRLLIETDWRNGVGTAPATVLASVCTEVGRLRGCEEAIVAQATTANALRVIRP